MMQLLGRVELTLWPKISASIFTVAFVWLVWSVYRPANRSRFERESMLPLDD